MIDVKKLERLMELMNKHGVSELELDDKTSKVRISSGRASMGANSTPPETVSAVPLVAATTSELKSKHAAVSKSELKEIRSPFVGTFYASPSPDSDPFVQVGHRIKKGDVLCIVEAMKLMNEIEADCNGVIREILIENEQPVEFDQVLFLIE